MSLRYLLDVDVVTEPLRATPDAGILRRLRRHDGEAAIPSMVWAELRRGWASLSPSWERDALAAYLDDVVAACFPVLDYDRAAAAWFGVERARSAAAGSSVSPGAIQIAAIAATRDLIVVTAHPGRFVGIRGPVIEDWRQESRPSRRERSSQ